MRKQERVDVSLVHGWVHGRLATEDETEGHEQTVPGRHWRILAVDVMSYSQLEAGVLEIMTRVPGVEEPVTFEVIGSVEQMDKVMARNAVRQVGDDG